MKDVISRVQSSKTMNTLYCGLDVHKETTYATIINIYGEVQTQKRMKNEEIPDFLEPYPVEKVAMEASTYIMPLHRKLTDQGYDITVSHPRKTKLIAESRTKNDKVDSKVLAELLRLNALPESQHTPKRNSCYQREGTQEGLPGTSG
jgi:transposase